MQVKLRKVLKQPVTVGHLLLIGLTVLVTVLSLGASGAEPRFVAHTNTLSPKPPETAPVAPVVKTRVVQVTSPKPAPVASQPNAQVSRVSVGLTGTLGYAKPGGNCVNEPGVNNPRNGNPVSWPVLTQTPAVGATALFTWNHTGVVTGIWSNGDVEVRHQNFTGGQHRFPPSSFRGYR